MGQATISVAAATATINTDLLQVDLYGQRIARQAGANRVITGIGVCGSAAAGDTIVDFFVEDVFYGSYYNSTTGFSSNDYIFRAEMIVPAGAQIRCIIRDAPTTNPINVTLVWTEI